MKKSVFLTMVVLALALTVTRVALAGPSFKAKPFEFVGAADACGPGYPAGIGPVAAAWEPHEGLPDAGNSNYALFLQKDAVTADCSAAGAIIDGVGGITLTELGFDVRDDGHCGAGAPRFNVVTADSTLHFLGCAAGPLADTLTDPQGNTWTRKRWGTLDLANPALVFPPIAPGSTVLSISIIFDEGTDQGTGFTFLDNIDINGTLIGKPGNAK
jgi:hypothetical protein